MPPRHHGFRRRGGAASISRGEVIDTYVDDMTPRYLEAERITLSRTPGGVLRMTLADEACYPQVAIRRLLPLSQPDRYFAIAAAGVHEVGILVDPVGLDADSRTLFDDELDRRYLTPVVTEIHSVRERFDLHEWDVESSHGRLSFYVRGLHQNVKSLPPHRLLITDIRGNRYDIPDITKLDPASAAQIERHL